MHFKYTKIGIFILITYFSIIKESFSEIYNPFTKFRTGKSFNTNDNERLTTLLSTFLNDDNIDFSTSKPSTSSLEKQENFSKKINPFETLFNTSSTINKPKVRSVIDSNPKARSNVIENEKRQNNPSVDEILSGLIQLIGGNMKLNKLPGNNQPILNGQSLQMLPPNLLSNPNLKPILSNNVLNQLPNRTPIRIPLHNLQLNPNGQTMNNMQTPNIPSHAFFLGSNRPSLPLHFPPKQINRLTPNLNSLTSQQLNNQIHQLLLKPGSQNNLPSFNLSSLPINKILSNMIANNNSLNQIFPNNVLNVSNSSKSYIKVEEADVSRLLGLTKPFKNEIFFSSTPVLNNSLDSIHFPDNSNNSFNNQTLLSDISSFTKQINPTKIMDNKNDPSIQLTKLPENSNNNLLDLSNATVLSNNHNRQFVRLPIANLNNNKQKTKLSSTLETISIISEKPDNSLSSSSSTWQTFELFNTNNNLVNPTRTWDGNPPDIITKPEEASVFDITVRNKLGSNNSQTNTPSLPKVPNNINNDSLKVNEINNLNLKTSSISNSIVSSKEPEVVYGRPATNRQRQNNYGLSSKEIKPVAIDSHSLINPSPSQAIITSISITNNRPTPNLPSYSEQPLGKPVIFPVDIDNVKPIVATKADNLFETNVSPVIITESGGGSVYIDAQQKHFKLKPVQKTTLPSMQIGSTMNVYGTNNEENYSSNRKPNGFPNNFDNANNISNNTAFNDNSLNKSNRPLKIRRPGFRPKPATPLVRIDTCIVGDDSTCGSNANEHCKTEAGISSCHCKPGFVRHNQRGICIPTTNLAMSLKLDKLGDTKLQFSKNLLNTDSEEFQYLEFESIQTVNSLFQNSRLNKLFLGIRVNKFYPVQGKIMLNATIMLERNNQTRSTTIKKQLQQELSRVISAKSNSLGDNSLLVDSIALPRVDDLNECVDSNLNDCSKNARCINEFGTFSCVCKPGFEDRYASLASSHGNTAALTSNSVSSHVLNNYQNKNLIMKLGRVCLGCSPAYCSNRGDCLIKNSEKVCKCKGNYMGSRCDLDAEVLAVAFGGSLAALIIIIITILCLYIWNQKWKNEQQKMEAMSSGSGQTFSYVNKQNNTNNFRFGMEERMRGWNPAFEATTLQNNASNYNYYVNPEQLIVSTQQHVYATPSRVQTPDQLLSDDQQVNNHFYNTRRNKSKNCTIAQNYSMGYQPGIYNETEFSTRETLYTPSHLIVGARQKYSMY